MKSKQMDSSLLFSLEVSVTLEGKRRISHLALALSFLGTPCS